MMRVYTQTNQNHVDAIEMWQVYDICLPPNLGNTISFYSKMETFTPKSSQISIPSQYFCGTLTSLYISFGIPHLRIV